MKNTPEQNCRNTQYIGSDNIFGLSNNPNPSSINIDIDRNTKEINKTNTVGAESVEDTSASSN